MKWTNCCGPLTQAAHSTDQHLRDNNTMNRWKCCDEKKHKPTWSRCSTQGESRTVNKHHTFNVNNSI